MRFLALFVTLVLWLLSSAVESEQRSRDSSKVNDEEDPQQIDEILSNMTIASLIDLIQQQGIDIGEEYYSKNELISFVKALMIQQQGKAHKLVEGDGSRQESDGEEDSVDSSDSFDQSRTINHIEQKSKPQTIDNPLVMRQLPDNATVWELVKEKVRSDFAPFMMLVPEPVKRFVSTQLKSAFHSLHIAIFGAVSPMFSVASRAVHFLGTLLIHCSKQLDALSKVDYSAASRREQSSKLKNIGEIGSTMNNDVPESKQEKGKDNYFTRKRKQRKANIVAVDEK